MEEFAEWENYIDESIKNVEPLIDDLTDLTIKRTEANKTNDKKKALSYLQVEEDKCEEVVNALYDLYWSGASSQILSKILSIIEYFIITPAIQPNIKWLILYSLYIFFVLIVLVADVERGIGEN